MEFARKLLTLKSQFIPLPSEHDAVKTKLSLFHLAHHLSCSRHHVIEV